MANDVKSKVVLGIDVNEFRRGITQVDSSIKGISRQFQNLGGIIGASFAVGHIINFGKEAVKMASEFEQVAKGFQRFGSEAELQGLRKATRGLVTDLELMKAAVTAGNFAIPVQRLGNLLDFATRRANETGQSVDYLVNSIVTGIGRKSPLILDNLGISAVRLKEKFGGAALEAQSIADVTKAVSEIASEELEKMGEPIDTATAKLQRMYTAWENFKTSVGAPIAGKTANFLEKLSLTFAPGEGQMGGLAQAVRGVNNMVGTGGQFPSFADQRAVGSQGIFGAFPVEGTPAKTEEQLKQEAEARKKAEEAIRREYEKQYEILQNQLSLYEQMQVQVEETFKKELLEGLTAIQLEEVDLLEGEMVPILEEVRAKFDNVNLVAQQFGTILTSSFGAAIQSGEDFFDVIGRALKAYVQQLIAATAATVALAAVSSAFGGGTFLQAFAKVGQGSGLSGFFGGNEEFVGRVKGFELLLQQGRSNRNSSLLTGG